MLRFRMRRRSRPLSHCLKRPSRKLSRLLRRVAEHQRAGAEFAACLPPELRACCHLASQRDGQVLLHADSAAWATRLRYLLPELGECSPMLGQADKVRVTVRPRHPRPAPSPRPAARLSAKSADLLLECSKHIQDPKLADAFRRLSEHRVMPNQAAPTKLE